MGRATGNANNLTIFSYSGINTNNKWCYNSVMVKQILSSFAFVALSVASAATIKVSLVEPSVVKGKELKAGDYQLNLKDNSVIISQGKKTVEVPAKIEDMHQKFSRTRVLYNENKGKFTIQEIELGGTTTKLTFDNGVQMGGGE